MRETWCPRGAAKGSTGVVNCRGRHGLVSPDTASLPPEALRLGHQEAVLSDLTYVLPPLQSAAMTKDCNCAVVRLTNQHQRRLNQVALASKVLSVIPTHAA